MLHFHLFFSFLLSSFFILGHDHAALVRQLHQQYVKSVKTYDVSAARILSKSFDLLARHSHQQTMLHLLQEDDIAQALYLHDVAPECEKDVQNCQHIVLCQLYLCLFKKYIKFAKSTLDELVVSKTYWSYEKFCMNQRSLFRSPTYLLYFSSYHTTINAKLRHLDQIEEQVARVLGICLYGMKLLTRAENEEQLYEALHESMRPLYELYHMPLAPDLCQVRSAALFMEMRSIHHDLSQQLELVDRTLYENKKPNFAMRHFLLCAGSATAAVVAGYVALNYADQITQMATHGKGVVRQFVDEYVVDSVNGLVDVIWHGKKASIPEIPDFTPAPHMDFSDVKVVVDAAIPIPGTSRTIPIKAKIKLEGAETPINNALDAFNEGGNKLVKTSREGRKFINDTYVTNQQVNMHLIAIGPVLFAGYLLSKGVRAGYNRYVKHDNWYVPMKYLLRSISRVLNDQNYDQRSFVVDGKLYMLASHMQDYITCLQDDELMMMEQDIQDLLSLDLNYYQKQKVVERMYRSYQFLR